MGIRARILLAITLAVLLSIFGVTVMVSHEMNKAFVNNFQTSSKAQLDRMNAFVETFFASARSSVELLAASPVVRDNIDGISVYIDRKEDHTPIGLELPQPERGLYDVLAQYVEFFPSYTLVYVANKHGGITQAPDDMLTVGYNPAKRPWYLDTLKAGKSILTEAYISDSGAAVCTVATPIRGPERGAFPGAAAIDISLDTLTRETGTVTIGKTGYVVMIDSLGQIISDPRNSGRGVPEKDRWLGKTVSDVTGDAGKALVALNAMKSGYAEVRMQDKDWLASVQTTSEGWKLVMLQEKSEIFADAMGVTLSILLVGGIIALVMLGIAWFVARSIAGPVATLAAASQSVAEGDLNAIPQEEAPFKGELGILHKSLKSMVAKLVELIETANDKIREAESALTQSHASLMQAEEAKKQAESAKREGIMQAAEQIGAVINQLSEAAVRLTDEARRTGQRTEEQRDRVRLAVGSIEHLADAVNEVTGSAAKTADLAEEARGEARNGKKLVLDVVRSMGEIEKQSASMQQGLAGLGAMATDIGQIMNVISDIADQTNLLALNAAIEAARAGDAGRGFAVVADEVRKLAEKTMEATKQVGSAITSIQQSTGENVAAMEKTAAYIGDSTSIAQNAGEAISGIEKVVDATAGEVQAIAEAGKAQSGMLADINASTDSISSISDEVAKSAHLSNDAAQELMRLSGHLNAIVEALKKG